MTRIPPNSDIVAFGGFDREAPIDRAIPGIVEGALQKLSLCARGYTILTSSSTRSSVSTLMTLGRSFTHCKKRNDPVTNT